MTMLSDKLTLRLPGPDEAEELWRAYRAIDPTESIRILMYYEEGMPFARYLQILDEQRCGINLPQGFVPSTFLFAFVGDRIVGRVSIRHELNEALARLGGHIGYIVLPAFRRRGYATEILRKAIAIARADLGIERLLVTCDDDNIGSMKVIEKNGGQLESTIENPKAGVPKRRYWIESTGRTE